MGLKNPLVQDYINTYDIVKYDVCGVLWGESTYEGQPYYITASTEMTDTYTINLLDGECNDFERVQFAWINSFGMFDYFTTTKRQDKGVNIRRDTFYRDGADYNSSTLSVGTTSRGWTEYSQEIERVYTSKTDFLSDEMSEYLKNLYISPSVFVRYENTDEWIPVVITDSNWQEKTFRKDKLFQHTFNWKHSHNLNSMVQL